MDEDRLLNARSHVVHRYPAFESCNIDAIPLQQRVLFRSKDGTEPAEWFRYCKRCFRDSG